MMYTPQQVLAALKQKQYASVYFFQGEESYYIDLLTNYIEKNVLSASEKAFNLTIVYGKDQAMHEVLTFARRFPMGGERQVVIVKEAQELQDFKKEEGRRLLAAYIQSPQPTTLLVWAYKHKALDTSKALGKMLAQQVVWVHTKKVYDNQVAGWVAAYVRAKNLNITEKATMMLQECVGNNLTRLANDLNKIELNLGHATEIDDVMVQTYVGISRTFNAFELQKALAQKNLKRAYQIVLHFAENPKKNPAIPLVSMLSSFFSKLLLLYHTQDRSTSSLAKVLRVSPYFVQEYRLAAQHYSLTKVINNIHYLHEADLQLKGITYPSTGDGPILQELIYKLTSCFSM